MHGRRKRGEGETETRLPRSEVWGTSSKKCLNICIFFKNILKFCPLLASFQNQGVELRGEPWIWGRWIPDPCSHSKVGGSVPASIPVQAVLLPLPSPTVAPVRTSTLTFTSNSNASFPTPFPTYTSIPTTTRKHTLIPLLESLHLATSTPLQTNPDLCQYSNPVPTSILTPIFSSTSVDNPTTYSSLLLSLPLTRTHFPPSPPGLLLPLPILLILLLKGLSHLNSNF